MEEPKKVLRAQYLGSMQVSQATGMDVLNDAIEQLVTNTPINQWRNVNVAIAPSMISILTPNVSSFFNYPNVEINSSKFSINVYFSFFPRTIS